MIGIIITAAITVLIIGGLMIWYLSKHNHEWTLIDSGYLYKKRDNEDRVIGIVKVYECKVCKKMKKNLINY